MKHIFLLGALLMMVGSLQAQTNTDDQPKFGNQNRIEYKNEISTNLLDLVVAGTLTATYESMYKKNQSFLIGISAFDTYGYMDAGYLEASRAFSARVGWVIYTGRYESHSGFHFYPLLKLRIGEVEGEADEIFQNGVYIERSNEPYDISGFSAGFGLGYKWVVADQFSINLNFELTRNLGGQIEDEEGFSLGAVEPRTGVTFGYRF